MALLMFFAIGVVEMFIVAAWTKFVSGSQMVASGVVTFVNTLIYFYVLDALVSNAHDTPVIVAYAIGCALGTMVAASERFSFSFTFKKKKRKVIARKKSQHDPRVERGEQFSPIGNEPASVIT
jgi:uncharacterized protein YebE (UPF0316 family)